MKNIFCLILILFFSIFFSQKIVKATIITSKNDTLKTDVRVVTNMFDPTLIYGSTFNKKFTLLNNIGEKTKMETIHVKELSFIDFNGKQRKFINKSQDKKTLAEIMHDDEILEWGRFYTSTNGGENSSDYLFNKETKQGIGVGYFTGLPKKKLIEFMKDVPEMEEYINSQKAKDYLGYETEYMKQILIKYEQLKSNKQ